MPTIPPSLERALALALAVAALPARADCIADAAARHQVNADVLRAIGWQESRLQPAAIGRNANGSVDVGAFQINSVHLGELRGFGIDRAALADGCVSADVAAWHYRRQVERLGNGWQAVGAYHSRTAALAAGYADRIAAILMDWRVLPPGALPFAADAPRDPAPARPPGPRARALAAPMPAAPRGPSAAAEPTGFSELAYLSPTR